MIRTRYRLTGRLESGELAELFLAQVDERERVVVKLFHQRTSDPRYARAIAETQRRLEEVDGEGIIRILDVGTVRGRLGIAREHVDGYTLGQGLQRLNTREVILPSPLALYVILQLADAVHRAHEQGVMHGAITPGNILLGRDGRVGIVDFGALEALRSVPELKAFSGRGRSAYRAPEVSQGSAPAAASDVYSLGAIAYELLTLREPLTAEKTVSTRHAPLPPPSRLDRRINARLDPIILRALELTPGRRFRSCAEFSSALRNLLAGIGGMPSRSELARLVGELFPNEVQLQVGAQVPFAEPFELAEVDGAEVIRAEPVPDRTGVLTARPSFSSGAIPAALMQEETFSGSETIEALPVVPEPESWEAPPGEVPQGRKLALGAGSTPPSGISLSVRQRVRVREDFEATAPLVETVDTMELPVPSPAPRRRPDAALVRDTALTLPPISEPEPHTRPMITAERRLWRSALTRRRYLALALGVALVGAFCFGLVVWRFGRNSAASPAASAPPPAPRPSPLPEPAPLTVPARAEPDPEPEPEDEPYRAPKGRAAWLTVTSNVPAKVYIDGKAAGSTPLRRVKVAVGTRSIALVSSATGERREFSKRFRRNQSVKLEERFAKAPRR